MAKLLIWCILFCAFFANGEVCPTVILNVYRATKSRAIEQFRIETIKLKNNNGNLGNENLIIKVDKTRDGKKTSPIRFPRNTKKLDSKSNDFLFVNTAYHAQSMMEYFESLGHDYSRQKVRITFKLAPDGPALVSYGEIKFSFFDLKIPIEKREAKKLAVKWSQKLNGQPEHYKKYNVFAKDPTVIYHEVTHATARVIRVNLVYAYYTEAFADYFAYAFAKSDYLGPNCSFCGPHTNYKNIKGIRDIKSPPDPKKISNQLRIPRSVTPDEHIGGDLLAYHLSRIRKKLKTPELQHQMDKIIYEAMMAAESYKMTPEKKHRDLFELILDPLNEMLQQNESFSVDLLSGLDEFDEFATKAEARWPHQFNNLSID